MATTTAQLILTSTDLLSDSLSLSAISTLTTAGSSTGVTQASGLSTSLFTLIKKNLVDYMQETGCLCLGMLPLELKEFLQ